MRESWDDDDQRMILMVLAMLALCMWSAAIFSRLY